MKGKLKNYFVGLAVAGLFGAAYLEHNYNWRPFVRKSTPWKDEKITEADYRCRNFPSELEGAKLVTRYGVPGSSRTIVHVKQVHYTPPRDLKDGLEKYLQMDDPSVQRVIEDMIETRKQSQRESYLQVERVQKNIALILGDLKKKGYINHIRCEGLTYRGISQIEAASQMTHRLQSLTEGGIFGEEELGRKVFWISGAPMVLRSLDSLNLLPADSHNVMSKCEQKGGEKYIYEPRENSLIELVARENEAMSVVVYGMGHDLKNNVDEWNEKNPKKKFSLIEIEPRMDDPGNIIGKFIKSENSSLEKTLTRQ